jgi:hypothetical protein
MTVAPRAVTSAGISGMVQADMHYITGTDVIMFQ